MKKVKFEQLSKEELFSELPKLARLANDRMRALEKSGHGTKSFAYGIAMNDIRQRRGLPAGQKPRFKSGAGMSYNEAKSEYAKVVKFLKSEQSTVRGVERVLAKSRFEEMFDVTDLNKLQRRRLFNVLNDGKWKRALETMSDSPSDPPIRSLIHGASLNIKQADLMNIVTKFMESGETDWAKLDDEFNDFYINNVATW